MTTPSGLRELLEKAAAEVRNAILTGTVPFREKFPCLFDNRLPRTLPDDENPLMGNCHIGAWYFGLVALGKYSSNLKKYGVTPNDLAFASFNVKAGNAWDVTKHTVAVVRTGEPSHREFYIVDPTIAHPGDKVPLVYTPVDHYPLNVDEKRFKLFPLEEFVKQLQS